MGNGVSVDMNDDFVKSALRPAGGKLDLLFLLCVCVCVCVCINTLLVWHEYLHVLGPVFSVTLYILVSYGCTFYLYILAMHVHAATAQERYKKLLLLRSGSQNGHEIHEGPSTKRSASARDLLEEDTKVKYKPGHNPNPKPKPKPNPNLNPNPNPNPSTWRRCPSPPLGRAAATHAPP